MKNQKNSRRDFFKFGAASALALTGVSLNAGVNDSSVKFDEEWDVIVIGSGFAGLAAAAKAAKKGNKVLVLEKMGRVGGNSTINGGAMAVPNNELQKANGIKDSSEIFIKDSLKAGLGINHTELLEVISKRAIEAFNFTKECGAKFKGGKPAWFGGHSVARTMVTENNSGSGIIKPMSDFVESLPGCKLLRRVKFDDFVVDSSGKVIGVTARTGYRFDKKLQNDDIENKSGKSVTYKANKGVVLASGGFCSDKFFRKLQDPRISDESISTNHIGATSGALQKAFKLGAASVHIGWIQFGPWASPDERGFGVAPILTQQGLFKYGMAVDVRNGKRFMNELADRKTRADAEFKILKKSPKSFPVAIGTENTFGGDMKAMVPKGLESGVMKKYNTLDEVAKAYGIPASALKESVKKYNKGVKDKKDEFGKPVEQFNGECINESGPFYCVRLSPKPHHTMGGLKINTKAEVISAETAKPIPGLYAAGEVTGGTHGASRLGSCAITDCIVFGMIAGENF